MEVLCHVEVGLRHAIDSAMTIRHSALGRPDEWLDFAENTPEGAREIGTRAVDDITAAGKTRRRTDDGRGQSPFHNGSCDRRTELLVLAIPVGQGPGAETG